MESVIFASDMHGYLSDPASMKALHKATNILKPTHRICGGDLTDMTCLREGATKAEKAVPIAEDMQFARSFIKQWKPTAFLMGNHDYRLWRAAEKEKDDALRNDNAKKLCEELEGRFADIDCEFYHYEKRRGVHSVGNLNFIHGFAHGKGCLATTVQKLGVSVVTGHCHTPESVVLPKLDGPLEGHMAGCLCNLEMGYNATALDTLRWQHGFIYAIIAKNGDFLVYHIKPIGDQWIIPSSLAKI